MDPLATKKEYEDYLNEIGVPDRDTRSYGGLIPDRTRKYGAWLRKNDPIAFNVGHREYSDMVDASTPRGKKAPKAKVPKARNKKSGGIRLF